MAEKLPWAGDADLERALAELRTHWISRPLRGFTEAVLRRITGVAFARGVLGQDPQQQYLTDPVVWDERVFGVKVQPNVTRGEVQRLLVTLADGMARSFPGKSLAVMALSPSGDKLAEAHYDPRTNRVDVQFVQEG